MFKKLLATAALVLAAHTASAAVIVTDSIVTGADMAGVEVTVSFYDTTIENGTWAVLTNTPNGDPNPTIALEGFSGGASNNRFNITQQGNTLGNIDDFGNLYGLWELANALNSSPIRSVIIDGTNAQIAFDTIFDTEETPNSSTGRAYVSNGDIGTATYSNLVDANFDDLYYTLRIDFAPGELGLGESFVFMADTDKLGSVQGVNAPATLLMTMLGFAAFIRARKS
jgi:hypothetical protein